MHEAVIALRLVLQFEQVPCLPHNVHSKAVAHEIAAALP
jgi:hypothetical protein